MLPKDLSMLLMPKLRMAAWLKSYFIAVLQDCLFNKHHIGKHILIIDGHGFHKSLNLIDLAIANEVILYHLLPYATHLGQPLKMSMHKLLRSHFSTITCFFTLAGVTDGATYFPILFKETFEKTMPMKRIISGFQSIQSWSYTFERKSNVFRWFPNYHQTVLTSYSLR